MKQPSTDVPNIEKIPFDMNDTIEIFDLEVPVRIGVTTEERAVPQELLVDIVLSADTRAAGKSDNLEDTIDYQALSDEIRSLAGRSEFRLVERFAEETARICIQGFSTPAVQVRVKKPGALPAARTIAVSIQRTTGDYPPTSSPQSSS